MVKAETEFVAWLFELADRNPAACSHLAVPLGAEVLGDRDDHPSVYLVETGAVVVTTRLADGSDHPIGEYPSGSVVGERALAGGTSPQECARALQDSVLIRVPASLVMPCLAQAEISKLFLAHLGRRFDQSYARLKQRG